MPDHDPLVDLLDRALADVGPVAVDGLADRLDARLRRRQRRRRTTRLVPLAAAVVLLAAVVTVLVRHDPPAQVATDDGAEAGSGLETYGFEPGWHELEAGPLGTAGVAAATWTGDELVVLFASAPDPVPLPDGIPGAAFDPSTRRWRAIAPMPLPGGSLESVWTGAELIVVRSSTSVSPRLPAAAAAWDAATDTWRLLPSPPTLVATGLTGAFWTGTEAVFPSRLARYDVATGTWLALPELPPESSGRFLGGWTGDQLVLARTAGEAATLVWSPGSTVWTAGEAPPTWLLVGAATIGDRLVLARASSQGAGGTAYDSSDGTWTTLPSFDPPQQRCSTSVAEVGGTVAVNWCSTVALLAPDRWIDVGVPDTRWPPGTLPDHPGMTGTYLGQLVGAGDALFGLRDLSDPRGPSLDLYVPAPDQVPGAPPAAAAPPPGGDRTDAEQAWRSERIGSATLDLPDGYSILPGRSLPPQLAVAPPVEPGWPIERPCTLRSLRASDDPAASLGALHDRSSRPEVTHVSTQFGRPAGAFLVAGDLDEDEHVIVSVSADEVIDIACARLLTSIELAQYLR